MKYGPDLVTKSDVILHKEHQKQNNGTWKQNQTKTRPANVWLVCARVSVCVCVGEIFIQRDCVVSNVLNKKTPSFLSFPSFQQSSSLFNVVAWLFRN